MCLVVVRMELTVLIGTRRGGKFHPGSDGLKMLADMTKGANEVHSGCLALSFILCLDIVCTKHEVLMGPIVEECFAPTRTDLKCMPT